MPFDTLELFITRNIFCHVPFLQSKLPQLPHREKILTFAFLSCELLESTPQDVHRKKVDDYWQPNVLLRKIKELKQVNKNFRSRTRNENNSVRDLSFLRKNKLSRNLSSRFLTLNFSPSQYLIIVVLIK